MSDEIDMLDRTTSAVENLLADFDKELLAAPTPCTEWTVSDLLDHLVMGARMLPSWRLVTRPPRIRSRPGRRTTLG
jgi:uncharacterized protein (TIGR03083 family)